MNYYAVDERFPFHVAIFQDRRKRDEFVNHMTEFDLVCHITDEDGDRYSVTRKWAMDYLGKHLFDKENYIEDEFYSCQWASLPCIRCKYVMP